MKRKLLKERLQKLAGIKPTLNEQYNPDSTGCPDPQALNYDPNWGETMGFDTNQFGAFVCQYDYGCAQFDQWAIQLHGLAVINLTQLNQAFPHIVPGINDGMEQPSAAEMKDYICDYICPTAVNINPGEFCPACYAGAAGFDFSLPNLSNQNEGLSMCTCCENIDAGVEGCTDPNALNYNEQAVIDDGSCEYPPTGCTDPEANNYDEQAEIDDGSCEYLGCTDPEALNYDEQAEIDDGSCEYPAIYGCMDQEACNYNPNATIDVSLYPGQLLDYQCQYRYRCTAGWGAMAGESFCDLDCENGMFNSLEECQKSGCEEERPYRPRPDDPIKVKDPVKDTDIDPTDPTDPNLDRPRPDRPLTPIGGSDGSNDGSISSNVDDYNVGLGPWFCPMDQGNFPWPGCCVQVGAPSVAAGFQQYPDDYVNANNQAMPDYVINATWPNNDGINYWSSAPGNATLFPSSFSCNFATGCANNMANPLTGANCGGFPSDYDYDPPIVGLSTSPNLQKLRQRLQELAGIKNKK